jgi:long-subunit acyl-CoA synthetase (AMP-forming)
MYAVSTISIPATGGVLSGFSHRNSPSEALYQLTNSEAVLLITTSDRLENILHLIEKMPHLRV